MILESHCGLLLARAIERTLTGYQKEQANLPKFAVEGRVSARGQIRMVSLVVSPRESPTLRACDYG